MDIPVELRGREAGELAISFRHAFRPSRPITEPILTIRAMKNVIVFLDAKEIYADPLGYEAWKRPRHVPLPPLMTEQEHVIILLVRARDTHPAVLAHCNALNLRTSASWEASINGANWMPTMLARNPHTPELAHQFPSTYLALARISPSLALIFGLVATWTVLQERGRWATPPPATIRWYLLFIWAILAVNNSVKLPAFLGMDLLGHMEYIRYLSEEWRVPLANEGWQMFQSPLYYLLSAPFYSLLRHWQPVEILHWLRIIPLLCGLAQVEVCYRAVRAIFPERDDLQVTGTILGGFLPMNLYISQVIGNEPLAGLLASLAIFLVLQRIQNGQSCLLPRFAALLGTVLGLALLAKATTLLLVPVLVASCLWSSCACRPTGRDQWPRRILSFVVYCGGPILLITGWYYVRNWVLLGRPVVGGWDSSRGFPWWQDHGYITIESLLTFGEALVRPVYAQTSGIWNGLYCTFWLDGSLSSWAHFEHIPPWNYNFVLSSALLALIPCAMIGTGIIKGIRQPAVALSVVCIVVYVGAVFALHLSVLPCYSTIKATYLLGLLPCFAILAATGLDALPRNLWIRATAHGLFACWAASAYLGYFVI